MEKKAISISQEQFNMGAKALGMAATAVGLVGLSVNSVINKINNDAQRKRLLEDLALNDPVLKNVDKGTLLGWYAAVYNVAPTLSKDRHTVQEILRNFQKFGKIDVNTLKLLADTEKSVSGRKPGTLLGSVPKYF